MEVKCLELRDAGTFIPVICIRPVPDNEAQRYLLRRDGYSGHDGEHCIIMIDAQCRGVAYDPYNWTRDTRTKPRAHLFIQEHWWAASAVPAIPRRMDRRDEAHGRQVQWLRAGARLRGTRRATAEGTANPSCTWAEAGRTHRCRC